MPFRATSFLIPVAIVVMIASGCVSKSQKVVLREQISPLTEVTSHEDAAQTGSHHEFIAPEYSARPRTAQTDLPTQSLRLTLDAAIALSLQNTKVLRSLNATCLLYTSDAADE